jgi:amino acid adenylation domain-containing protein
MSENAIEGYRLSPQQERLWYLCSRGEVSAYRSQCAALIEGNIDSELLQSAINHVIARHEILRTSLRSFAAMSLPLQVISESACAVIEEIDLSTLTEEEQVRELELLYEGNRLAKVDHHNGSALEVTLARVSESSHVMSVSAGATWSDRKGLKNLIRDVIRKYEGKSEAGEQDVQYADVSEIFNELIESEETKAGREYWARRAQRRMGELRLVVERNRKGEFSPKVERQEVSQELREKVKDVCPSVGVSEEAVMLSVFGMMIGRMSGEGEVRVGVSYDGRTFEGLREAVGVYARYLPLDINLDNHIAFSDLAKLVDESAQEFYKWQHYFDWRQSLTSNGADGEESYFPYLFEYEAEEPKYSSEAISYRIERQYSCVDRFKVRLSCYRSGDDLAAEFHYDSTLYDSADIIGLASHYLTLLQSAAQAPRGSIGRLEILSAQQREKLLNEFNQTRMDYHTNKCVHELIQEQAERKPEAVAVVHEQGEVSYKELNSRANQLASYLRNKGVGPEQVVGVMISKGIEMVVGTLGVMKAGAAYLPLDADYPKERLAYMLQDARVSLLLTERQYAGHLPERNTAVIYLDMDWGVISQESNANPAIRVNPQNLVYVIYTSGSTGSPKGAMITHGSIVNCLCWMQETYKLDATDRFLMKTSLTFDPSVWELFWPLWAGGVVVLADPQRRQDTAYLTRLIEEREATSAYFVPSMLRAFLNESGFEMCRSLRRVICGGESLSIETVNDFFDKLSAEFHHSYGPTETSIAATEWTCRREGNYSMAPIGRPLGNTQVYILEAMMQPAPLGVPGELYIGGTCVGRGYLNRADLTAERFVPDLFSTEPGARFYKTGDIARYLPDGNITFCGRLDNQVKLRGYRIELGEVEAALRSYPKVREAVVEAREDEPGEKRLVGYVVGEEGVSVEELREYLRGKLPEYMAPGAYVLLEELPLTPNGKVDRKSLLKPEALQRGAMVINPRDTIEIQLKSIWEEILGVDNIGIRNNFFELGGHSLKAVALSSRLAERYQAPFLVRNIFEFPTIEEQAAYLKREPSLMPPSSIVPIQTQGSRSPVFCVHPGGGGVGDYIPLAYHLGKDQPLYGIQCIGLEDGRSPVRTIESMAEAYLVEMKTIQPVGPYQIAGWSLGGTIAYEMAIQLSEAGETVSLLAVIDKRFEEQSLEEFLTRGADLLWEEHLLEAEQAALQEYASAMYNISPEALQLLAPEERISHCLMAAKLLDLVPSDISFDHFRRFVRVLGTNLIAETVYHPRPYRGLVTLFRSPVKNGVDPYYGFGNLAIGGIEVYEVPGDHYTLLREPNVEIIAEKLKEAILRQERTLILDAHG